ncbi:MAG TPA: bifunctional hydroxymethylpyrimidine kinase/phosphomethylpyrimidine kinase [Stellaceae bacterium]|nr:bifunctional hydroxymethylpyrimidine kinase/phosphomethylpyrimidine kinase [Stellaceae bacterium]
MKGRVLVVAGSDSGAGAGIQADIKTIGALGGYATTAITALTAQNTRGVQAVMAVPPDFIRRQIESVFDDIGADCIKTGMLHSVAVLEMVGAFIAARAPDLPLVVDPVLAATDGTLLLDESALDMLKRLLIPRATVLTPNVPEAEALTGTALHDIDAMTRAAQALVALGSRYVLVKGGHLPGALVQDVFVGAGETTVLESARIETSSTHGTGCTLASAIAVGLAQGMKPLAAARRARTYLSEAIRSAPGLGSGHGPLNHMHTVSPSAMRGQG